MTWDITKLHPLFGAKLCGPSVKDGLGEVDRALLLAVLFEHGVIVLPDQPMEDAQLAAFAMALGPIYGVGSALRPDPENLVYALTNIDAAGNLVPGDARQIQINIANQLWHTDSTYTRPGAMASVLHGRVIPPVGGETQFCDTRIAFERLAPAEAARLGSLTARHSLVYSRRRCGFEDWSDAQLSALETIDRPLIHCHRPTGRMALCLASHIGGIVGMPDAPAMRLIERLIAAATAPERIYTHHWSPNDLLLWDNRCTMHRAVAFDSARHARDLRTIRIVDVDDI